MVTQTSLSHSGVLTNQGRNSTVFAARPSSYDVSTGPISISISGIFNGAVVTLMTSTDDGASWIATATVYRSSGTYKIAAAPITTLYRLQLTSLTSGYVNYNVWSPNSIDMVNHEIALDPIARSSTTGSSIMSAGGVLGSTNRYLAAIGDSRIANTYDRTNAPYYYYEGQGIPAWISYRSNQTIFTPPQLTFGVGGDTTLDVLNRLPTAINTILQNGCNTALVLCGTNDRNSGNDFTMQQSIDNMSNIIGSLLGAGIWPILLAEMPRGDAVNTSQRLTSPQLDYHLGFRDWMRYSAPSLFPGLTVVDCWPTLALYSSATGDAISGVLIDGLHQNLLGARIIADTVIPVIQQRFPTPGLLPTSAAGIFNATNNPRGWINSNPVMTGSIGVAAGFAGNSATGWTCTRNSTAIAAGGTNTMNVSKIVRTNSELIQLSWTNLITTSTSGAEWVVYQDILANCTTGDILEAIGPVEVDAGHVGICRATLSVQFNNTGATDAIALDRRDATSLFPNDLNYVGIQRTPQCPVPAIRTTARLRMSLILAESTTSSGTIRFGAGCKKVF
jgi:lysophospholipase L1-like esterase